MENGKDFENGQRSPIGLKEKSSFQLSILHFQLKKYTFAPF
jgi:hypothetical protein